MHEAGAVHDVIQFGPARHQQLIYQVVASTDINHPVAQFEGNSISVTVPEKDVVELVHTDRVGIKHELTFKEEEVLNILVEKDFKCLSERAGEDESDMFPNPDEHSMNC